jgi:hypothetical protein
VVLGASTALFDRGERAPVTICSYEMLRNQQHKMGTWEWQCVIFDESHKLATRRTQKRPTNFVEVAHGVAERARRVIMLSGSVVASFLVCLIDLLVGWLVGWLFCCVGV